MAPPVISLNTVSIGSETAPTAIIFLHGSGGGASNLADTFRALSPPDFLTSVRILFPTALPRPYTLAANASIPVWFDRTSLSSTCVEDVPGLRASAAAVRALAAAERARPHVRTLIVGGFSQGGCAALYAAYAPLLLGSDGSGNGRDALFDAAICASSFLVDAATTRLAEECRDRTTDAALPPLLLTSQRGDVVVPPPLSRETMVRLRALGVFGPIESALDTVSDVGGAHWPSQGAIAAMVDFVDRIVARLGKAVVT